MFMWTPPLARVRAAALPPMTRAPKAAATAVRVAAARRGLRSRPLLVRGIARAPVPVFEPHDVVEVRGRDLEEERVLERDQPVYHPRRDVEARSGLYDLRAQLVGAFSDLEARSPAMDVDRLVLVPVELQAQCLSGADEQQLPDRKSTRLNSSHVEISYA